MEGIFTDSYGHMQIIVSDAKQNHKLICNNNEEYNLQFSGEKSFFLENKNQDFGTFDVDSESIEWSGEEKSWTRLHVSDNQMFVLNRKPYVPMTFIFVCFLSEFFYSTFVFCKNFRFANSQFIKKLVTRATTTTKKTDSYQHGVSTDLKKK